MATEAVLPQIGTKSGRISLDERRRYRRERDAHVSQCSLCAADRLPAADAARAACKLIHVDPAKIAYTAAELTAEEREAYQIVAAQATALVVACRLRSHLAPDHLRAAVSVLDDVLRSPQLAESITISAQASAQKPFPPVRCLRSPRCPS